MELTFYLKDDQPDTEGRFMIHGRICWASQKVRFSTSQKTQPAYWKSERVKLSVQFASDVNRVLSTYQQVIGDYFQTHQQREQPQPSVSEVRQLLDQIRTDKLTTPDPISTQADVAPEVALLADFASVYVAAMQATRSPEWQRSIGVVGRHLQAFQPGLNWPDLRLNTLNQFKVYLQEEEDHSDNTIHTYIGLLCGMLDYAGQIGIVVPRDYTHLETRPGKVIRPVLTEQDIWQLGRVQLDSPAAEGVRWYFLMACHTGLRRVDQWQLLNPTLSVVDGTNCLMALQQKTGGRVAIPLSEEAHDLLRNPATAGRPPAGETYNTLLRKIAEQAGLNRLVTVGSFYKGELIADSLPLHQVVSSHIARRTFATRLSDGGLNTIMLQHLMGHESVVSTQNYVTVSDQAIVKETVGIWAKQSASHPSSLNRLPATMTPLLSAGPFELLKRQLFDWQQFYADLLLKPQTTLADLDYTQRKIDQLTEEICQLQQL